MSTLQTLQAGPYQVNLFPTEKVGYLDEASGIHYPSSYTIVPRTGNTVVVSLRPLVISYPGVLSPEECQHLISLGAPRMKHSVIGDTETVGSQNQNRTSTSAYLEKAEDAIVTRIEQRLAYLAGVPPSFIERLQVIRYIAGQEYKSHWDSNGRHNPDTHGFSKARGYQRVHTMLVYLAMPDAGETDTHGNGVTLFPLLAAGTAPVAGDAIYWRSTDDNLEQYDEALHQGLPVTHSEKWALNVWIHETPLDYFGAYLDELGEFRSAIDQDRATRGLLPTSATTGQDAIDHTGGSSKTDKPTKATTVQEPAKPAGKKNKKK